MTHRGPESFGDAAAEMANESEVEASNDDFTHGDGDAYRIADPGGVDTWLEEGGAVQDEVSTSSTTEADGSTTNEVLEAQLAERTLDLQRLQAEFVNYKRRVDRDRELIRENATYVVLEPIIDVLDNIDRAREHGQLDDGFKSVAEQLERVITGLGLTKFGDPGDKFDPNAHDALSHLGEDPDVTVPTAKMVAKAGYRIGERVVRPAQVLVVDPPSHD